MTDAQGASAKTGAAAGRNPLLGVVLANRGYDRDFLASIEDDSHGEMLGVDSLVAELRRIHDGGIPITIYPDFDMDGIMSGTVLYAGMSELGFDVNLYVPDPSNGYGINRQGIDELVERFPGTRVIITCDVGITAMRGVLYAKEEHGIDTLVTDHHAQRPGELPDALAIVDPMRDDDPYAHPEICGAFVAWKCLMAYAEAYEDEGMRRRIMRLRVFSGIGTISDSMPVMWENRSLIRGMQEIMRFLYGDTTSRNAERIPGCPAYRKAFLGLHLVLMALLDNRNLRDGRDSVDEFCVGFYVAPMFNSVKRLDGDLSRAFGVFFGDQQASDIDYLLRLNEERKRIVAIEYGRLGDLWEGEGDARRPRHVFLSDARPGVLGLLANKAMGETGEPAFVLTRDDEGYSGSGRCPAWLPALTLLRDARGYKLSGHQGAFGARIDAERDGVDGAERLEQDVREIVAELAAQGKVTEAKPDFVLCWDGVGGAGTDGSDVDWDAETIVGFVEELYATLRPFGQGLPEPRGTLRMTFVAGEGFRPIGRDQTHAKGQANGMDVLCWGQWGMLSGLEDGREYECVVSGTAGINRFRGSVTPTFSGDIIELHEVA